MESYDKNGKKQKKHFPEDQRKIWNCTDGKGIVSDVLGSYSGADIDEDDAVQDQDDL